MGAAGGSWINPLNVDISRPGNGEGWEEGDTGGISYSVKLNRELERRGARIPWNSARSFPSSIPTFVSLARVPRPRAALLFLSFSRLSRKSGVLNKARWAQSRIVSIHSSHFVRLSIRM